MATPNLRDCNGKPLAIGAKVLIPATVVAIDDLEKGVIALQTDKPAFAGTNETTSITLNAMQVANGTLAGAA